VTRVFCSLGSNLGDRRANLAFGVASLADDGDVLAVSPLYETAPWGGVEQDPFLNVVVELDTELTALQLLDRCLAIEAAAHRVRDVRWGPRTLDIDVLLFGQEHHATERLTVPHPRMFERAFVLAPLADLAPELVPPSLLAAAEGEVTNVGML
jgi:2-amino-4-hydroxy-6-hydroxymethyldihydropteridine diphosphokinase